jgi:hypothetical protein
MPTTLFERPQYAAEVISKQRRHSVVGWFHGEPIARNPILVDAPVAFGAPQPMALSSACPALVSSSSKSGAGMAASLSSASSSAIAVSGAALKEWISPVYLKPATVRQVRARVWAQVSVRVHSPHRASGKYFHEFCF